MSYSLQQIQQLLITINKLQVLVDRDVTAPYGVASKEVNQAEKKEQFTQKSGELMTDVLDADLEELESETYVALNFTAL
jgi:hypothetical protein